MKQMIKMIRLDMIQIVVIQGNESQWKCTEQVRKKAQGAVQLFNT